MGPNFITTSTQAFASFFLTPEPSQLKTSFQDNLQKAGLIATASVVMSVAGVIFGMTLISSGGFIGGLGLSFVSLACASGFLSYNVYKALENLNQIISYPGQYVFHDPDKKQLILDDQKLRDKFLEGTLLCYWIATFAVNQVRTTLASKRI